ncbi:MAG: hypothetical protein K0R54_177 [Clostridiaceae bacterium]|jgi:hypothetical protein|nr:hypothetical protein [Clostridiaceae bacterium]
MKNFIKDLKENWIADVLYVGTGIIFGLSLKYVFENFIF